MAERVEQSGSTTIHQSAEPISDVTRWMLMGEIREAFHRVPRPIKTDGKTLEYQPEGTFQGRLVLTTEGESSPRVISLDDIGSGVAFRMDGDPLGEERAQQIRRLLRTAETKR